MDTHVVIMAGGIGSRFWPMSTPDYPKQFLDVLGCGRTLIQMTVDRLLPICPASNVWIVTSAGYAGIVKEQLPGIPEENILAEPAARNTAPCIAYACWKIMQKHPHANIVVTPSDALVLDADEYRRVISKALDFTVTDGTIVTVGIKPSRPETGYGYILAGKEAAPEVLEVCEFKEKPDIETAKSYLADGHYLWNAGIFVWNVSTITDAIRTHAPGIAAVMDAMAPSFGMQDEKRRSRGSSRPARRSASIMQSWRRLPAFSPSRHRSGGAISAAGVRSGLIQRPTPAATPPSAPTSTFSNARVAS